MTPQATEAGAAPAPSEPVVALRPAVWPAVAFVCSRCEDRKGAPKSLSGKKLGKRLREAFRDARVRSRVVATGCMGLCPRGAMVAAVSLGGAPLVVAELRAKRDVPAVVRRLTAPGFTLDPSTASTPIPITSEDIA